MERETVTVSAKKRKLFKDGTSVITLSLLHPIQAIPVQSWSFDNESTIRVGRAMDNHVILYSAVVSRHHAELRRSGSDWEVVNVGTNGIYFEGKKINKIKAKDGMILRLAYSGPKIQIRIDSVDRPNADEQNTKIEKVIDKQQIFSPDQLPKKTMIEKTGSPQT